jgi:hypothetical protein
MTLIHQFAYPFAYGNGASPALIGDAGIVECGQKARIRARFIAARIGLCRRGHADYSRETCKRHKHSHRFIFVRIRVVVLPSPRLPLSQRLSPAMDRCTLRVSDRGTWSGSIGSFSASWLASSATVCSVIGRNVLPCPRSASMALTNDLRSIIAHSNSPTDTPRCSETN